MSKFLKRSFAVSMSMALLISSFVGCGKKEVPQTAAQTAAPQTKEEEKKPTLRILNIWQKDDYNTYPVSKFLEEKTGYKVEYEMMPADKPEDKLNLVVAAAEPYDLITTVGSSSWKALYSDYAKKGALLEVTPLIEKYGPNVKAAIPQANFDAAKVDGKVFAVPTKTLETSASSLLIRTDWLDKVGMKMPATLDEFVAVLKAFKEKDPGGNGADKNIALSARADTPSIPNIIGAFGMPNDWNDIGGKLVPKPLDPAFKEYVAFMTDLYKQGLLDKEFATNKDAIMKEKFTSGRAGAIPLNWSDIPTITDALQKNKPEAKIAYVPALKGKDGKFGLSAATGFDRITYIPKASKNPEHAMKWMNAKLEKDTFKELAIGKEGVHHTVKDGAYFPILPIFNDERNMANNYLTGVDEKLYPTYWQARVRKDQRLYDAWAFMNLKEPAETRKRDVLAGAPYLAEYSKNNQQLLTSINDYIVKVVVSGEGAAGLDAFVQKYKAAGGDVSYKEVNDWYSTSKK
mgnify:CR=1 FL=1